MKELYEQGDLMSGFYNETSNELGIRLERIELYNWGSYDGACWAFTPERASAIISGESGSGKSTILDAMLTLLLPNKNITYNRAAEQMGSGSERTKRNYILGTYAVCKDEVSKREKRCNLRDHDTRSILLAVFSNPYGSVTTIAQVFYFQREEDMKTIFLVSEDRLSIPKDFTGFTDIQSLREHFQMSPNTKLFTKAREYQLDFRQRLGLTHAGALRLWQNAAFMKSVGDVDEFIKTNMLEPFDVLEQVSDVYHAFSALTKMKETIRHLAEKQNLLESIVNEGTKYQTFDTKKRELHKMNKLIRAWQRICEGRDAAAEQEKVKEQKQALDFEMKNHRTQQEKAKQEEYRVQRELTANGAGTIQERREEIVSLGKKLIRLEQKRQRFDQNVESLGIPPIRDEESFRSFHQRVAIYREGWDAKKKELVEEGHKLYMKQNEQATKLRELQEAIRTLTQRPSNIEPEYLKMREEICKALNIPDVKLPFVGELMEFREDANEWKGAAERLLHSFSLSLIVDESLYPAVSDYVNQNRFKYRLVYYRVKPATFTLMPPEEQDQKRHVYQLLRFKEDSPYAQWLVDMLHRRYHHVCAETMEYFRQEEFALTKEGQIRNGNRHEKFDKKPIDDASYYVIGFHHSDRLARSKEQAADLVIETRKTDTDYKACDAARNKLDKKLSTLRILHESYSSYDEIDVESCRQEKEEKARALQAFLDEKGNLIRQLEKRQRELNDLLFRLTIVIGEGLRKMGAIDSQIQALQIKMDEGEQAKKEAIAKNMQPTELLAWMESFYDGISSASKNDVHYGTQKRWEEEAVILSNEMLSRQDRLSQDIGASEEQFQRNAKTFLVKYPDEKQGLSPIIDCLPEFVSLLNSVQQEKRTKLAIERGQELIQGPFQVAADAANKLLVEIQGYRDKCREKMEVLNEHVGKFPFGDAHRHIQIEFQDTTDEKMRAFIDTYTKYCAKLLSYQTEGEEQALDDAQIDQELEDMRPFFEKFNLSTPAATRAIQEMTDARRWLDFYCIATNTRTNEQEICRGSGWKSGGERELLAYTILAAGLKYDLNLSIDTEDTRNTFRLLFVDEAFLKSSSDIRDAVLKLFQSLALQVVMITPSDDITPYFDMVDRVAYTTIDKDRHVSQLTMYRLVKDKMELQRIEEITR